MLFCCGPFLSKLHRQATALRPLALRRLGLVLLWMCIYKFHSSSFCLCYTLRQDQKLGEG